MSEIIAPIRRIEEESLTTGEAVELEIRPASPLLRFVAAFVDLFVTVMTVLILGAICQSVLAELSSSMMRAVLIGTMATVMVIAPTIVETSTRGQSLGKWAMGIRVVRDDGGVITVRHSFLRAVVASIESWMTFGSLAFITMLASPKGKRLGDYAAGTLVVRIPEPAGHYPIVMPEQMRQWAVSAIILPLPSALHNEAFDFLQTNRTLNPQVRERAAMSLLHRLMNFVETPPPPGVHPERIIAAILVVTRDMQFFKEQEKLTRAAERRAQLTSSASTSSLH